MNIEYLFGSVCILDFDVSCYHGNRGKVKQLWTEHEDEEIHRLFEEYQSKQEELGAGEFHLFTSVLVRAVIIFRITGRKF